MPRIDVVLLNDAAFHVAAITKRAQSARVDDFLRLAPDIDAHLDAPVRRASAPLRVAANGMAKRVEKNLSLPNVWPAPGLQVDLFELVFNVMMGWTAPHSTVAINRVMICDHNLEAEMTMKVIGLDIAKHVFQVHGVPFERAGGGRAKAPPLPTLQLRSRRTRRARPLRSWWSQGRGPRGTWASKARTGHWAGIA